MAIAAHGPRGPTISAGVARALADFAISRGAPARRLYERAGIDPKELTVQDARLALDRYEALMHAGQALCNDGALALHFGEAYSASDISIVGAVNPPSSLLGDAFALLNRYAPLAVDVGGGDRFRSMRRGTHVWIVDQRPDPNAFPELTESTFARMTCMARQLFPDVRFPLEVHVTHRAPPYQAEYERIFRAPIVFASDLNALVTGGEWVGRRKPPVSRYMADLLEGHAESLLDDLRKARTARGQVEQALIPLLSSAKPRVDAVAAMMNMSRQTLFRRLKAEDTTFEQILDELRRSMAVRCVCDGKAPMREIARQLGFADATAFSRAFRRWTGTSPGAMRRDHLRDRNAGSTL